MFPQHLKFADDFAAEPGDTFIPAFDMADLIGVTDYVRYDLPGSARTLYDTVVELREDIQYAKVESWNGALRWVELDYITLILKGAAIEACEPAAQEEWRDLPGYEGLYQVSDFGRVKALARHDVAGREWKENFPHIWTRFDGRQRVQLRKDGVRVSRSVHSLVMLAFVGAYPLNQEINHIDGNPLNNALTNLEYCTASQNQHHAFQLGLRTQQGARNSCAKLDDDKVREIRNLLKGGMPQRHIGKMYGVSDSAIYKIAQGKSWQHVEDFPQGRALELKAPQAEVQSA